MRTRADLNKWGHIDAASPSCMLQIDLILLLNADVDPLGPAFEVKVSADKYVI